MGVEALEVAGIEGDAQRLVFGRIGRAGKTREQPDHKNRHQQYVRESFHDADLL
jgi:hypothetical protein